MWHKLKIYDPLTYHKSSVCKLPEHFKRYRPLNLSCYKSIENKVIFKTNIYFSSVKLWLNMTSDKSFGGQNFSIFNIKTPGKKIQHLRLVSLEFVLKWTKCSISYQINFQPVCISWPSLHHHTLQGLAWLLTHKWEFHIIWVYHIEAIHQCHTQGYRLNK